MEFMWLKKVLMMDSNNTNVSTSLQCYHHCQYGLHAYFVFVIC